MNVKALDYVLAEVVRRIVEVADPERIILFGSAARGEIKPGSDLDLLVVKPGAHAESWHRKPMRDYLESAARWT